MIKRITYLFCLFLMFFSINMICNAQNVNDLEQQVNKRVRTKDSETARGDQDIAEPVEPDLEKQGDDGAGGGAFAGTD